MSLTSRRRKQKAPLCTIDLFFAIHQGEKNTKNRLRTKFNFLFQVFFLLLIVSQRFRESASCVCLLGGKAFDVSRMRCVRLLIRHVGSAATFWLFRSFHDKREKLKKGFPRLLKQDIKGKTHNKVETAIRKFLMVFDVYCRSRKMSKQRISKSYRARQDKRDYPEIKEKFRLQLPRFAPQTTKRSKSKDRK